MPLISLIETIPRTCAKTELMYVQLSGATESWLSSAGWLSQAAELSGGGRQTGRSVCGALFVVGRPLSFHWDFRHSDKPFWPALTGFPCRFP